MTNTELIRQEIDRRMKIASQYSTGAHNAFKEMLSFIDSLPKETPQGWISVKDSLPEETGFYFTCINIQGIPQCVGVTYFDATRRGGEWIEDDEDNCIANVDCWMPIPKFKED